MKRLLVVLTLICSLSLPAFGGHTQLGGGAFCKCTPVEDVCPCCGGSFLTAANNQENDSISQHDLDSAEPMLELGVIRLTLMTWLKIRA